MSKLHAKLSASSSTRWIACGGSVKAEEGLPNTSSVFADEGTAAHELGELVLEEFANTCFAMVGKPLVENNATIVTQEMAEYVQQYVDYVDSFKGTLMVEQRVDFSDWVEGGFGTCDALILDGNTLRVIDLKYGKGVRVDAEDNTQGILYALGAVSDYGMAHDIQHITISIVQPRLDHISEWALSIEELMLWGERISQAAEIALSANAPRVAGEKQCQWCKAKATCPALKAVTESVLLADLSDLTDIAKPDTLTDSELRDAMDNKKLILSWFDAVETLITERLESGKEFNGYKLVEGRSNRAWGDEATAAKTLMELVGDEAYTRKLITPPQAEKLLGKKRMGEIEPLIVKPVGSPTLVPESDKRPAVNVSVKDFD